MDLCIGRLIFCLIILFSFDVRIVVDNFSFGIVIDLSGVVCVFFIMNE